MIRRKLAASRMACASTEILGSKPSESGPKNDGFSGIGFDSTASPSGLYFVKEGETRVHVSELSGGERPCLVLLADLARRLQAFESGKPLERISAIVPIDDIELNLHPAWPGEILPTLAEVFGSCRFIAATHSPEVLSGIDSNKVRKIGAGASDCRTTVSVPKSTRDGIGKNLPEEIIGASERCPKTDELIGKINDAINRREASSSEKILAKLNQENWDIATTLVVMRRPLKKLRKSH